MNENRAIAVFKEFGRNRSALLGGFILCVFIFLAIFANYVMPHEIDRIAITRTFESPSSQHIFGTDNLGRDIFSRMIYAARISLTVGFNTVIGAGIIGSLLGAIAGYKGGFFSNLIMRVVDIQLSLPPMLVAIVVVSILGRGLINIILVLIITTWPYYARLSRSKTLEVKEELFVEGAKALGATNIRIMLRHIIPNITSSIVVLATVELARAIIVEASLSFLGLGVPPEIPTYGAMISSARSYIGIAWWYLVFPGLALLFIVLGVNLLGDGINDIGRAK